MSTAPRPRSPWIAVAVLLPGILLALADATAMSVAIPLIVRRLESSVSSASWVMNAYNLTLSVLLLTMGRLADRFGRKRLFIAGLMLFTLASIGCATASTIDHLIAFRVVQAIGAAAVIPAALTLLLGAFSAERQGFAAGLFGGLSSAAAALGPTLAGILLQRWGWPAIFWFNVPIGLAGIVLALALLREPESARDLRRIDWPGILLSGVGLFCLTLALLEANNWGWTSSPTLALLVAAAAALFIFVVWELRTSAPLFDLHLMRRREFSAAALAIATVDVALMGAAFMLVIFMIAMMDYSELKAGLAVTVLPAAGLLLAPFAGRLVDRIGARLPAVVGALITAAGLFALGHLERTAPLSSVIWRASLVGVGLGLSLPALTAAGMSVARDEMKGAAAGVLNTARQIGFLLGVAILVAVFAHTMAGAVDRSADRGQQLTREQASLPGDVLTLIIEALDDARKIDVTIGVAEIYRLANPIADAVSAKVGVADSLTLWRLTSALENIFWDEAAAGFRWPFYTAALAALFAVFPSLLLPGRPVRARKAPGDDQQRPSTQTSRSRQSSP